MKLAMTLRTRLFLSISALITVALLGLLLGLVSVMQMAGTQEALIRDNFVRLDTGLKLRQTLGDQLIIMLGEKPDPAALEASRQHYLELLDEGIAREPSSEGAQYGFKRPRLITRAFCRPTIFPAIRHRCSLGAGISRKNSTRCATV